MPNPMDFLPPPPWEGPPIPRYLVEQSKGGNPNLVTGTCYEDAARFVIRQKEGELVHGTAISLGRRLGHAWVELPTGYIWEPYSGSYLTRQRFHELVEPIEEHRYTSEEIAIMILRTGNFGPWTDKEREAIRKE